MKIKFLKRTILLMIVLNGEFGLSSVEQKHGYSLCIGDLHASCIELQPQMSNRPSQLTLNQMATRDLTKAKEQRALDRFSDLQKWVSTHKPVSEAYNTLRMATCDRPLTFKSFKIPESTIVLCYDYLSKADKKFISDWMKELIRE